MATRTYGNVRLHHASPPRLLSRPVLEVDAIQWRNVEFRFQPPLRLHRTRSYGHVVLENSELTLYAYGKSNMEALEALARDFAAVWNCIAQEEDAMLEASARRLKRQLRKAVASVWRKV
ncbi:MAG: hypothetical protein IT164_19770 [Bryobacterales bacterium]|nr:hypothetical protein [Bryobacterales bacterium]